MTSTGSSVPPVSFSGGYTDATDERYRSTLRYLSAMAHAEAEPPKPHANPPGHEFVRDVMVRGVVAAHEEAVFKEIVDALARNHISAAPVVDDDRRVIGVVSESDLLSRMTGGPLAQPRGHRMSGHAEARRKRHADTARDLMTSPAIVTTPDTRIIDAARLAAHAHVRRLPVVDTDGILVGIVTRTDLLRIFLRPDSEIADDIRRTLIVGPLLRGSNRVTVEVTEGVAALRGHIEGKLLADALVASVHTVPGVVDVNAEALNYLAEGAATS